MRTSTQPPRRNQSCARTPAATTGRLLPSATALLTLTLLTAAAVFTLPGATQAQSSMTFNRGCGPVATWPRLGVTSGQPKIGTTFVVTGSLLAPSRPSITAIGLSNTMWGSVKLPLMLDPRVGPPCQLLVSPDVLLFGQSDNQGQTSWKFPVPNDRRLIGLKLYMQMAAQNSQGLDYFTEGLQLDFG